MTQPPKLALTNGCEVTSTHMRYIVINGIPFVLTGHIIPNLSILSLFGLQVLTEAGCKVTFNKHTCKVCYKGKVILTGLKDPATDLWMLPLGTPGITSQHITNILPLVAPVISNAHASSTVQIAFFMNTVCNKANSIHFAYQLLHSPRI